jgi:hypothetical protein
VTPANGSYDQPVSFAISGLPADVTANFNPNPVTPGSSPVPITLTLTEAPLAAQESPGQRFGPAAPMMLALLLPLLGVKRYRRLRRSGWLALVVLLASIAIAGSGGCGANSGSFSPPAQNYTATLTATSGTATHSTTFNLTVE